MGSQAEFYVAFDFKGASHRPAIMVDLDSMMEQQGSMPNLYPLLAKENGIGLYSYELEVMESLPLQVAHAEGLAAKFVEDGVFDQQGFELAWKSQYHRDAVIAVAQQHMAFDPEQETALVDALMAAFQLGQQTHS